MVIHKHPIEIVNRWFKLKLVKGAVPLSFQIKERNYQWASNLVLWEMHDETVTETKEYDFIALGTGVNMNLDRAKHIGTATCEGFVWHLFWRINEKD